VNHGGGMLGDSLYIETSFVKSWPGWKWIYAILNIKYLVFGSLSKANYIKPYQNVMNLKVHNTNKSISKCRKMQINL